MLFCTEMTPELRSGLHNGGEMDFLELAMEGARKLGVDYADIRIQKRRSEEIFLRNLSLKNTSNISPSNKGKM